MFVFAMGKVWNTFWSRIKFSRVRIETNFEGGGYWFDILWNKRGQEFRGFGDFSLKILLLQKFFGSMVLFVNLLQKFWGGVFFRRQCVSMMIREISFFKFNGKVRPQNIFSHIVMKTNEGTFLTFLRSCGPKQFKTKLPKWLVLLLKLIETSSSWQVIYQH